MVNAAISGIIAVLSMKILRPFKILKNAFIALGDFIGGIMTRVILSHLYISVIALIWIVAKLFGKKFIDTPFGYRFSNVKSYWIPVDDEFNTHTLEKWELPY